MGFQLTLTIDVEDNPDAVGEALRIYFFAEKVTTTKRSKLTYRQLGCYETFDCHTNVEPLDPFEEFEDG